MNPQKALVSLCAARSIKSDTLAAVTLAPSNLDRVREVLGRSIILGGAAAAVELSDNSEHVFYLRDDDAVAIVTKMLDEMGAGHHDGSRYSPGNVVFLPTDKRAARTWRGHTSFAQTYADLFVTPGWQASEFRLALQEKFLGGRDWDRE